MGASRRGLGLVGLVGLVGLALLAALVPGCADPPPSRPGHPRGLEPLVQREQPTASPHLAELQALGDALYVANSNDVFAVYRVDGPSGLELALDRAEGVGEVRCTTLAVHEPSASLYCGNDAGLALWRFALDDPFAPTLDPLTWAFEDVRLEVRDLEVLGDRLYLARYDAGLAWTEIGSDGRLGELHLHPLAANVRLLAGDRERLWVLTRDRGLIVLEPDAADPGGGQLVELAALELDGPPLDLRLDLDEASRGELAQRAIVALGSAGARIVDLVDGQLIPGPLLSPPGAVVGADIQGDAAGLVALTGTYLYDLRPTAMGGEPRIAGFNLAGAWNDGELAGSALYARFVAGDLFVTDWSWVERYHINLDGEATGVDIQSAAYHGAGAAEVRIGLRNPGPIEQQIQVERIGGGDLASVEIGPFEQTQVVLDAAQFEIAVPEQVIVTVRDGDAIVDRMIVVVLRRPADAGWPVATKGAPAPGDGFPTLTLARGIPGEIEPFTAPLAGEAPRVVFYGSDCVAMWAEIEDMAWRHRRGRASALLLSHDNIEVNQVLQRWQLDDVPWGFFGPDEMPPELAAQNAWVEVYDQGFALHELPSAAHHPTDYELDASGRVLAVEREYRGDYPLHPAAF